MQYYYATREAKQQTRRESCRATYFAKVSRLCDYLLVHPCVDCGEADPVVLEFDHVRGEKVDTIANLMRHGRWSIVLTEIEKCDVRCANCHARRHAATGTSYKAILATEAAKLHKWRKRKPYAARKSG